MVKCKVKGKVKREKGKGRIIAPMDPEPCGSLRPFCASVSALCCATPTSTFKPSSHTHPPTYPSLFVDSWPVNHERQGMPFTGRSIRVKSPGMYRTCIRTNIDGLRGVHEVERRSTTTTHAIASKARRVKAVMSIC